MEYSDEYLRGQLPREDPRIESVPGDVLREIQSCIEQGDFEDPSLLARSVRWTYAIFFELGLGNYRLVDYQFPFMPFRLPFLGNDLLGKASIGLYDPNHEQKGFGLCIDVPGWDGPDFYIIASVHFTRLKQTFPLAVRSVETELHAAPNPTGATSTCWARCKITGNWGIITAGHAISTSLSGIAVPMDNGSTGISSRSFWQPIDAAFVLTTAPSPMPGMLPIQNFPAAGIPVVVECQSGIENRIVASACNSLDFYKTRSWPVLFFLDNPCKPGDSGALVHLPAGEASGIYLGAQPSPGTGGQSGRVLNFAQAMFALDTTPYR